MQDEIHIVAAGETKQELIQSIASEIEKLQIEDGVPRMATIQISYCGCLKVKSDAN